jgi:hypothetical protein
MNANDSLFWTSFYTFTGGFLLAVLSVLYKSKCKSVKLCGILEIDRDVDVELQEDTLEIQQRNNPVQSLDRPII